MLYDQKIDWFYLHEGKYLTFKPDSEGLIESQIFPRLILAVNSLLQYDLANVLSILQQQLNSEKHSRFVEQLNMNG